MQFLAIVLTLLCYGLAVYFLRYQGAWTYLIALVSGHLAAPLSPLWQWLYGVRYAPSMPSVTELFGHPLPFAVLFGLAWFYMLPALLVYYLYQQRFWFNSYITALFTYGIFLLYHILMQRLGVSSGSWSFVREQPLPLGLSPELVSAVLASLVSLVLLYILLASLRYSFSSLLLFVLPSVLIATLLVHGVLGAPLWVTTLLTAQSWALTIGLTGTFMLVVWAIHINASGITGAAGSRV